MKDAKYRFLAFHCRCCGVGLYGIPIESVEPLCKDCVSWVLSIPTRASTGWKIAAGRNDKIELGR